MARYVILARSEITASALGAWIKLLGEEAPTKGDPRRILWDRGSTNAAESVHAYERLVDALNHAIKDDSVHHLQGSIAVLVDSANPGEMSAISDTGSWNHLLAMLILTFPEIRWHFGCLLQGVEKDTPEDPLVDWSRHRLPALVAFQPWDPTFDPTGLRNWIRVRTQKTLKVNNANMTLALRPHKAAVIDEETDYARVHGLTAYRFGLRADLVTTWASMEERFGKGKQHEYKVLLEDMSLNFPDRKPDLHLIDLENERADEDACPALRDEADRSDYRILITTGQSEPGKNTFHDNKRFLRAKSHGIGKAVFKPASGMFDLWEQAGIMRRIPELNRLGNYEGFTWPPTKPPPETADGQRGSNHGAPGKLLMIADQLLHRAECLRDNIHEAADAILGAVLATDALELTGGRTPTTALQALVLKHEFEVMAECRFSGVEYHIAVKPRLSEIDQEIRSIGFWFHHSQRTRALLNARMHIFSRLVNVFNEHHQFDEEQLCMNKVRHLHNTLWMRQHAGRYLLWPFLRYVEVLIGSFTLFVAVLVAWVLGLAGLYSLFHDPNSAYLIRGLEDSLTSFFSIGGPIHHDPQVVKSFGYVSVICLAVVSGFIHLGIFISHLYSMLSRK